MPEIKSLENVFHLVHLLKRHLHGYIEKMDFGVAPMQVRVMKIINRRDVCTAVDIAQFLNRDKAQVTRLLKTLIDQGLVEKVPNPEDKRSQRLLISESGAAILDKITELDTRINALMAEGISEEELQVFQKVAGKMAQNLAKPE